MPDWSDRLSASARRVLNAAEQAAREAEREPNSLDLLKAMLADEGEASERLRVAVDEDAVSRLALGDAPSYGRLVRLARKLGPAGEEISSLHLLGALLQDDLQTAEQLAAAGVDVDSICNTGTAVHTPTAPLPAEVRIAPVAAAVDDLAPTWRILDAAANRAREGLRVLEDHARFGLNDHQLTTELKDLRHRLAQLEHLLLGERAIRFRDTPRDVGTGIHTRFEVRRESDLDIVRANSRRTQEALRTLEEYGKRVDAHTAVRIGELRYASYTLEQALLTNQAARLRLTDVQLCLLATDHLCPSGVGPVVREALQGGCRMVQLREKDVPAGQLVTRARFLREWTRSQGALLIINDRPDIAVLIDADGVHVGQEDLSCQEARQIVGGDRLVGVSTHNVEQIRRAVLDGADYLGVGPVFPSTTKTFEDFAGLDFVREAAAATTLPWFAIGGITAENVAQVLAAGGERIAVTGAICQAEDPQSATSRLQSLLSTADREYTARGQC
ncbi:MAG: thiamine phosphate synthase [Planctomycetaceae bacterium]